MQALRLNSDRSSGLSVQIFSNFIFELTESNSSSTDGLSKINTLRIAHDRGSRVAPSSAGRVLISIQLLNIPLRACWASIDLSLGGLSGAGGLKLIRICLEASDTCCNSLLFKGELKWEALTLASCQPHWGV